MTLAAIPQTKTGIEHRRVYYRDDDLGVRVRHGIGHRPWCSCGAEAPTCASVHMARGWLREHAKTHR